MNNLKTGVLLMGLTGLLLYAGAALGGRQGMTIALIFAFAFNFFSYWMSDKLVLRMYKAQPVTEAQSPELFSIVRELSSRAQLPLPKVYLIPGDQPNAFATGRNPEHSAIALTSGIMEMLDREELRGVLAHELAHIKNRDILIGTVAATIAGALTYLAYMAQWAMMFGGGRDDGEGGNPFAALIMMIVAPIAAMIVQMAISRSREFQADRVGAVIAGTPMGLAGALRKLDSASGQIPMKANEATAHMFIVNPLAGGTMKKLFSTHPPVEDRIARLLER